MIDDVIRSDIEKKMSDARSMISSMPEGEKRQEFEEKIEEFQKQIIQSKGYISAEMLKEVTDFTITVSLYNDGLLMGADSRREAFLQRISLSDTNCETPNKKAQPTQQCQDLVPVKRQGILQRIGSLVKRNDIFQETPDKLIASIPYDSRVPGGVNMKYIEKIKKQFQKTKKPVELIFEEGITFIPENMCEHLPNDIIQNIQFPKTLIEVCSGAFQKQTNLTSLDFSHTRLKNIGDYAFYQAFGLNEVIFPNTLEKIGYGAFETCDLREIDLSKTKLSYLGIDAFSSNSYLANIVFPSTLKKIGQNALSYTKLETLDLTHTKIWELAEIWNEYLLQIKLPNTIGNFYNWRCPNLSKVEIESGLPKETKQELEEYTGIKPTVIKKEESTESLRKEREKLMARVRQIDSILKKREAKKQPVVEPTQTIREDDAR